MAVYTDYTYYTGTYKGTAIAQSDFDRLAVRASAVIDQVTFNRAAAVVSAATDTTTIDKIKLAACAVAEELQDQDQSGVDGLTSERLGNYAVTYGANSKAALSNEAKQARAAKLYLWSTGLMFPGFTDDEA